MNGPAQKEGGLLPLVLVVFLGLLGLVLVFGFFDRAIIKPQKALPATQTITEAELPIVLELLKNPIFTEWTGGVEGKLVSKDDESITLEKDGSQLKIFLHPKLTTFVGESTPGAQFAQVTTIDKIPVGSYLRGGVIIPRGTLTGKPNQQVVGSGFRVISNP